MSTCSWSAILDQLQGALRPLIYVLMLTHQGNRRKYRQLRLIRKVGDFPFSRIGDAVFMVNV